MFYNTVDGRHARPCWRSPGVGLVRSSRSSSLPPRFPSPRVAVKPFPHCVLSRCTPVSVAACSVASGVECASFCCCCCCFIWSSSLAFLSWCCRGVGLSSFSGHIPFGLAVLLHAALALRRMTRTAVSVNTSAGLNTPSMLHATRPLKAPTNRPLPRQRDHAAVPTVLVPAADASASPPTAVVPRRKDLEERLQYLLLVEDRLTPAIVEDDVRQVIAELRRRRGERKAVVPPVRRASGAAGGVRPHVLALVQACEASSDAAAVEGLRAFHRSHYVHQGNEVGRSLVFTALAELLLMRRERSSDDVQEALSMLDVAVGDRHVGAMLQVGICLRDGLGVPRDLVAAITWIERAADAGYAPAMFELAVMYDDGVEDSSRCLESDWGEAMKWYRCAAELGHTMAQLNLGKLLWRAATAASDGGGGDSAIITGLQKRAREFLERAASAGNEEAVRLLRYR